MTEEERKQLLNEAISWFGGEGQSHVEYYEAQVRIKNRSRGELYRALREILSDYRNTD